MSLGNANCRHCEHPLSVGQTIVGFPIIRIIGENKSAMSGFELLYHVSCFINAHKKPAVEIIRAS